MDDHIFFSWSPKLPYKLSVFSATNHFAYSLARSTAMTSKSTSSFASPWSSMSLLFFNGSMALADEWQLWLLVATLSVLPVLSARLPTLSSRIYKNCLSPFAQKSSSIAVFDICFTVEVAVSHS